MQQRLFGEDGRPLFSKARRSGPRDGLPGLTGSAVTVRFGSINYTYGEDGKTIYAEAA